MVACLTRASSVAVLLCGTVLIGACSRDEVTTPRAPSVTGVVYGKAPTSLAVTSASPAFGDQGTTVDVHVLGTGFTAGAQAAWLLHGVADPAHVTGGAVSGQTRFAVRWQLNPSP